MMKLIAEKHLPGKSPDGVPITRTVRLYRDRDGRLHCQCPYLCLATYERCEFEGEGYEDEKPGWIKRLMESGRMAQWKR